MATSSIQLVIPGLSTSSCSSGCDLKGRPSFYIHGDAVDRKLHASVNSTIMCRGINMSAQ